MAEPFSTFSAGLQVAETAFSVGRRIVRFARDLKEVDATTTELFKKLNHLASIVETIEGLTKDRNVTSSKPIGDDEKRTLDTTDSLLQSCGKDIDAFAKLLEPLKANNGGTAFRRVSAQIRLDWNERHLARLDKSIHWNIMLLQTLSTCSEVVMQGDAMSRLAGTNNIIARNQEKMQSDITNLRLAFEGFSRGRLWRPDAQSTISPAVESPEEVNTKDTFLGRMQVAIEVTESLYDKMSSRGSISDASSDRAGLHKVFSNASTVEEDSEYSDSLLVSSQLDTLSTPQSSLQSVDSGVDAMLSDCLSSRETSETSLDDGDTRLKQMISLCALPLPVMENMLANHQSQAMRNLEDSPPQYEKAEKNLLHSLDCGATLEQAHHVPFKERFNIGITLAKAQIKQGKYTDTKATLESMRCLVGNDREKLERWSCASAQLYQYWYSKAPEITLLLKLKEISMQSYSVAWESKSLRSTPNQNLDDSAEALIAFYTWSGNEVAVKTLRNFHPNVRVPCGPVKISEVPGNVRVSSQPLHLRSFSEILDPKDAEGSVVQSTSTEIKTETAIPAVDTDNELLLKAARSKSAELVRYHIQKGDVNSRDSRQRSPLHLAILGMGGKDVVLILLESGADVNTKDVSGTSPLHVCSELDKDDIARALIARGANVNALDSTNETPLQVAVRKRRLRMVECLLQAGASVENVSKHSGSKEIDFLIQEHIRSSLSRPTSGVGKKLWRRAS